MKDRHLTLRGLAIGVLGLGIITASSMYVALRMGALPWPTVFVTVLSFALLGRAKGSSLHEINVTHTIMSSGAMVAGGLAFTLPGIWILDPGAQPSFMGVMMTSVCGAVLGIVFSSLFRRRLLEDRSLVFPMGIAAHETLVAGTEKGRKSLKLFISMGFSAIFTAVRDAFGWIPSVLTVFAGGTYVQPVTVWLSPMALAIGAVIDKFSAFMWVIGSLFAYFVLTPVGLGLGWFSDFAASDSFRQSLGIGIMLGTGLGVLLRAIRSSLHKVDRNALAKNRKPLASLLIMAGVVVAALRLGTGLPVPAAFFAVAGICLASLLSGMMTGQTGINPMEVFGIIIMLGAGLLFRISTSAMFTIAAVTAVSCGLTGDLMNDLKSGAMLGTKAEDQLLGEAVGGIIGAVISAFVLFAMKKAFGSFGTPELPAPQAAAVASMAGGMGNPWVLAAGVAIGAFLYIFNVPSATFGLGIYLSTQISLVVGLGAALGLFARKTGKASDDDVNLVSSGFLGGEGITGVAIAIISMFG